jgi:hypothetical protein
MVGHDKETPAGRRLRQQLEQLSKLEVRVGFQHGKEKDKDTGADIADVAMWNELGTVHSPPRPFLRQSVDNNASRITAMCKAQLQRIIKGEATAEEVLKQIGMMQKAFVQDTISSGQFTPNAPATVEKKDSDQPLIDTGHMMQSVDFVIQTRKGGK